MVCGVQTSPHCSHQKTAAATLNTHYTNQRSWNRHQAAELPLGGVGGGVLIPGLLWRGVNDLSYIRTSHHSWILETGWPLCAPTVTWFSSSSVECVRNNLCSISIWYSDWEPISRHYPLTRTCSWIRTPSFGPRRHSFPDTLANISECKAFTTTQDISLNGRIMQQQCGLQGFGLSLNTWITVPLTHPAWGTKASCSRTNEVISLHPVKN